MNRQECDQKLIANLREKYAECHQRYSMSKQSLTEEQCKRLSAERQVKELSKTNEELSIQNDMLRVQLRDYEQSKQICQKVLVKKKWSQLNDPGTKYKRKKLYRSILDRSVRCITECTKAKISLCLDEETVDFMWSEKDKNTHRQTFGIRPKKYNFLKEKILTNPRSANVFHRPVKRLSEFSVKEGIFNSKCQYSSTHIRKVVSVIDENRISQEAYQSLRNVCMGHMPSLNSIKTQKKIMSQQLPICGGEAVSFICYYVIVRK